MGTNPKEKHLNYREYLLFEVPIDLREGVNAVAATLPNSDGPFGFTSDGVRYRIYRKKPSMELRATCILIDAAKGATIGRVQLQAAMDTLRLKTEEQTALLAAVADGGPHGRSADQ